MTDKISPALSKIEIRIKALKTIQEQVANKEWELHQLQEKIELATWLLDELYIDKRDIQDRIEELVKEALDEGFTKEYVDRFLKERKYKN